MGRSYEEVENNEIRDMSEEGEAVSSDKMVGCEEMMEKN
jgi:hypothetical protein